MTQSDTYIEGQWYGWNGGECPVHPETIVDVVFLGTNESCPTLYDNVTAGPWHWPGDESEQIITFRVVKHHVEPKVIWVNESNGYGWLGHKTKEDATKNANKHTTRIAVCYVEKTNETE